METTFREVFKGIIDQLDALPDLLLPDTKTIIGVTLCPYRDGEIKITVGRIRLHHPHIIVDPRSPQARSCETIIQGPIGGYATHVDGPVHKNPVSKQQVLKLFDHLGQMRNKLLDLMDDRRCKISFKSADSSQVGSQTRPADLFINFVNLFPFLKDVDKACQRSAINTNDAVANQMVRNPSQFHDDDPHVIDSLGCFHAK